MDEYEKLDELLTEAALNRKGTVTIDRWDATKILMDLGVLLRIRKQIGLLDRRDELEIKE